MLLATSACSGGSGDPEAFCDVVPADADAVAVFDGFDPTALVDARARVDDALDVLGRVRAEAPAEIRDDIDTQVAFLEDLSDGLAETDEIDAARAPIYDELRPRLSAVSEAAATIERYVEANC